MRAAITSAAIDPKAVIALSLATTSATVVMLDATGQPLMPALLWMDVRAGTEAMEVQQVRDNLANSARNRHGPVSAEWMLPKALWLKKHERERYARAQTICEYQDYMIERLTGQRVGSVNVASIRWHYDVEQGGIPRDMLSRLDLDELEHLWPATFLDPGEIVGPLTQAAADHLGLPRSVMVVQGGADAFIGMIGAGVHQPGTTALISGSSHLQLTLSDVRRNIPGLWGSYPDAIYPGHHVVEGGQSSSGSMVAWLSRILGCGQDLHRLNAEASLVPAGSDGLLMLDHFQGGRSPHTDAASRGAIVGLTLAHTQAHLFRAAIESVCLGTRAVLETMRLHDLAVSEMTIVGGATRSPLWMQIHADTSGLPLHVPEITDGPGLGAAILAAYGAGCFPNIAAGIAAMVRIQRTIEPNAACAAAYDQLFADYRALYPAISRWRADRQSA